MSLPDDVRVELEAVLLKAAVALGAVFPPDFVPAVAPGDVLPPEVAAFKQFIDGVSAHEGDAPELFAALDAGRKAAAIVINVAAWAVKQAKPATDPAAV